MPLDLHQSLREVHAGIRERRQSLHRRTADYERSDEAASPLAERSALRNCESHFELRQHGELYKNHAPLVQAAHDVPIHDLYYDSLLLPVLHRRRNVCLHLRILHGGICFDCRSSNELVPPPLQEWRAEHGLPVALPIDAGTLPPPCNNAAAGQG